MPESTAELWHRQDRPVGDRRGFDAAIADAVPVDRVLYPGSYVDLAPSFVFDAVTYSDIDRRADRFFTDVDGVNELISNETPGRSPSWSWIHADYTGGLSLPDEHVDLLISLYAGFVSEHCTRHLRIGGTLLVNSSHGDAAMASIDDRYELVGVMIGSGGTYRTRGDDLDRYLVPKRPTEVTIESLHASGRGVAYTTSPFAYLFHRVS